MMHRVDPFSGSLNRPMNIARVFSGVPKEVICIAFFQPLCAIRLCGCCRHSNAAPMTFEKSVARDDF